jgi:hypothetical protein
MNDTSSSTGATKNDQEKVDLSLIPQVFLTAVAKAFMVGEKKYGRYNYTKGHTSSQLIAAALRHLTAYNDGEELDPKDGQPHLGSVGACIAMLLRQQELGTLTDNRFSKTKEINNISGIPNISPQSIMLSPQSIMQCNCAKGTRNGITVNGKYICRDCGGSI